MAPGELRRSYVVIAVALGCIFQFSQFIRSQQAIFGFYNNGVEVGDTPTVANAHPPPPPAQSVGSVSLSLGEDILAQIQAKVNQQVLDSAQQQQQQQQPNLVDVWSALGKQKDEAAAAPPDSLSELEMAAAVPTGFNFEATKFNYSQPTVPTEYTLPPPRKTNQSMIVVCLSAREHFERRAAIRATWSKENDNVYFIIGGPVPGNHKDMNRENPLSTSSLLFREQERFGDIIDTIHPDTYKSLPFKLHHAMRWVMRNLQNVEWIVKVDDDCVVRVKLLEFFVLRQMNPHHPLVIGTVNVGSRPHRSGKWAEDPKYTAEEYPPWAFGSAGYVVSRPVAQYVAEHEHYYYQGEDAGLGIWLIDSGLQVTWVDSPELRKDEGCLNQLYIIGHDLNVQAIHDCFNKLGDDVPERKHIIAFSAGRKDQFPGRIRNPN